MMRGLRQVILSFLAIFGLSLAVLCPLPSLADNAPALRQDSQVNVYLVSRKARTSTKKATKPVLVKNLRFRAYPGYTRLVLDLQRSVAFTKSRKKNPDRILVSLRNARLGRNARAKLRDKEFPREIAITQPNAHSVTVSLDMERISDYKLLLLRRPDRLVVDIVPRANAKYAPRPKASATKLTSLGAAGRSFRTIKTIILDPGHGGKDPGAIGRRGSREKDITLKVARRLRDLIVQRLGKKVLLTRVRDTFVDLEARANFANKHRGDLFVSIHVNSHSRRSTRGLEVYHFGKASDPEALQVAARENGTPIENTVVSWQYFVADMLTDKKIEASLDLAWTTRKAMIARLNRHYNVVDHGVKTAPFYVLKYTTMPGILAEIAFISNPAEERMMRTNTYLARMALAIFEGLKTYVNTVQTAAR